MPGKPVRGVVAALIVSLAGCAGGDVVLPAAPEGYLQNPAAYLSAADWSEATTIDVELDEYRFRPAETEFIAGRPYRLVLRNSGTSDHTFVSEGFFKAIAAQQLTSEDGSASRPILARIQVPAGGRRELTFVPVTRGVYDLECSVFLHETLGMAGQIAIR